MRLLGQTSMVFRNRARPMERRRKICWQPTSRRRSRSTTPAGRRRSCWSPITRAIGCRARSAGSASPKRTRPAHRLGHRHRRRRPALWPQALDAMLIRQNYSRLVIDCNRPPRVTASIPEISEATAIPGNAGMSEVAEDRARPRDFLALSRPHRSRTRSAAANGRSSGADRAAQLHAGLQGRRAAVARRACSTIAMPVSRSGCMALFNARSRTSSSAKMRLTRSPTPPTIPFPCMPSAAACTMSWSRFARI